MENNLEFNFDKFAQDVELLTKVCKQLMNTRHYTSLGEAGIFAILQRSKAMNIDPFDALNGGMYYINGKVGMSTELMASLIRKAGHTVVKDPQSDDSICILHGKRCDTDDQWTSTFSMVDADRAGLKKNMFLKYPSIMLYNRAMSTLARQLFPDVIKGCGYEKDELEEITVHPRQIETKSVIKIGEVMPKEQEPIVTEVMEQELLVMLLQDKEYKKKVEKFVSDNLNDKPLSELSYKDFMKIYNSTKKHLEKKNDAAQTAA